MKVLLPQRPGAAFGYITDGWMNALTDKGHTVRRWNGTENEWLEFNPDLYIGSSGHKQSIPKNRRAKVAIHVNPYGPVLIDGINESDESINWVRDINPDVVFGYGFETDRLFWSYWTDRCSIKWVPMPTAGDKTIFNDLNDDRPYDIVYLGGRWSYKAITIDMFLLPILRQNIKFKLHGWGDWPAGISSGILAESQSNAFLNSGKVAPCVSEKHTHTHGIDVPERTWKVSLCGTLAIHDSVPTLRNNFHSLLIARNPTEYKDMIMYYSKENNSQERKALATAQRNEVLNAHTYHHRLSLLLESIGFTNEANLMIEK